MGLASADPAESKVHEDAAVLRVDEYAFRRQVARHQRPLAQRVHARRGSVEDAHALRRPERRVRKQLGQARVWAPLECDEETAIPFRAWASPESDLDGRSPRGRPRRAAAVTWRPAWAYSARGQPPLLPHTHSESTGRAPCPAQANQGRAAGWSVTSPRVVKGHGARPGSRRTSLRRGRRVVYRRRRSRGRSGGSDGRGSRSVGVGSRRCAPRALGLARLDGLHRRWGRGRGRHGCPPARRERRQLRRTPQPQRLEASFSHHTNRTRAGFAGALAAWTSHRIPDCERDQANPDQQESDCGQASGHGAIRLVPGYMQPSARCGRRFCLSLKRVNFPMLSPRWTSTSRTTPAGNSRLRASNRTGLRPTTFFLRLTGHPRPTQLTSALAPLGARTASRLISVPSSVTRPTSLTIGNGLNILGSGVGPTSSWRNGGGGGPVAPAGGCARTETVSDSVEAAPLSSVTRRVTGLWPAVENLRVTRGPVASSKSPSPSTSQACSMMWPSRSSE
jgi:hypothetical protein